jgi:Fe-S-cluster containining protein
VSFRCAWKLSTGIALRAMIRISTSCLIQTGRFLARGINQTSERRSAETSAAVESMACQQCGDCCDPILLRTTKSEIRADMSLEGDEFILQYWHRVSKDLAFEKRPILRKSHYTGRFYYRCELFDSNTRRCGAHDNRPPACRAFPENLRIEGRPLNLRSFPNCGSNGT